MSYKVEYIKFFRQLRPALSLSKAKNIVELLDFKCIIDYNCNPLHTHGQTDIALWLSIIDAILSNKTLTTEYNFVRPLAYPCNVRIVRGLTTDDIEVLLVQA